jgi:hypothetical protein
MSAAPAESPAVPAKLRYKRSAAAAHEEEQPQAQGAGVAPLDAGTARAAASPPSRHSRGVRADLEDDGREKAAKALRITTSKILGTAQPRKPRIGPGFQAELPPLPAGPNPLAALRAARTATEAVQQRTLQEERQDQQPGGCAGDARMDG